MAALWPPTYFFDYVFSERDFFGTDLIRDPNPNSGHIIGMQTTPNNSKRQRGRPASGRSPIVSLALPASLLVRIDTSANHEFESRARAIRRLLETGLRVEDRERQP